MSKITTKHITQKKINKQPITMLTAYDYPIASIIDKA
ncbi:MAG: 3-methyl-2-oxobutanoate hydroxymethyltransferase, partial [Candidatus Omnitrophota bacterium]